MVAVLILQGLKFVLFRMYFNLFSSSLTDFTIVQTFGASEFAMGLRCLEALIKPFVPNAIGFCAVFKGRERMLWEQMG